MSRAPIVTGGSRFIGSNFIHTFSADAATKRCSHNVGPYHLPETVIPRLAIDLTVDRKFPLYADGRSVRADVHGKDHRHPHKVGGV